MQKLFTGFLFIILNFTININFTVIELLPNFIGWIFVYFGVKELEKESVHFYKLKKMTIFMVIDTALLYLLNLAGIGVNDNLITATVGVINTVLLLYIIQAIIYGIKDMEYMYKVDMCSKQLNNVWVFLLVTDILTYGLIFFPPLTIICMVLMIISVILLLFYINKSKNAYLRVKPQM